MIWRLAAIVPFLVALAIPASAQTTATALDSIAWNYEDAVLVAAAVQRFEVCFDTQTGDACANLAPATAKFVPTAEQGGPPPAGFSAYRHTLPAMTVGDHVAHVRACNIEKCVAAPVFSLRFVVEPAPPQDVRLIRGGL